MDLPTLASVLQLALSPNTEERKLAETQLNQFQHAPGHVVGLLQLVVTANVEIPVRQVASIQFKNFVKRHWSSDTLVQIPESDMSMVRENLLEALVHAPPLIRVQLGDGLKTVISEDYPEKWPSLLSNIEANLKSQDQQRVYGALYALRILTRKYEFKDDEERRPLYQIIETTFSTLLEILNYLLSMPNPPIEVAELIKLKCKIFWSSVYMEIPKQLHNPIVFTAWMSCFHRILERPVPLEGQPIDPDQRKVWGWWKVKKWTIQIMNRLYNRFGDPKMSKPENKAFAQVFQKQFAPQFLESHLKLLSVIQHGGYLPDRIVNLLLQYVSTSISKSATYQQLKPHLDAVLFEIIFPLMCFNDADHKLWQEDPHEYVRKGYDIIEDMYSSRTAAINFISELFRKRGKENLQKFLAFIVDIFQRYDASPSEQKPYRQKDGALLAVGALSDKLKETEPYKSQLEQMLVHHVYPEFNSPVGHLRAKAAWVSGQYASTSFVNQQNFSAALHNIVAALKDPELPVRVDSVVALRSFVESCKDLNEIRPILPQLLDEFFKLMNEVENEDLVFTLETIVDKFGEEMAPYALGLCQNLAAAFWKCIRSSEGEEGEEDDSAALAAVGCLRAISTILESVSRLPDLFPQVEPILLPILQRMLSTDGQDIFEELLEIVSYLTYFSPTISLNMWSLWPLMVSALEEWAIDFFENILVPLDNFVSRSTEHFLSCTTPNYQQSLFKLISRVFAERNFEDADIEPAPKLIEAVLQNCKGRVDEWVEPYLKITVERLRRTQKNYLKDLLIEVVANALYYNTGLTLGILQKMGVTAEIFQAWFNLLHETKKSGQPVHFRREHDKKVCILGLLSLLPLPAELMPQEVQSGLDQIFKAVLKLLVAYKEQLEEAAKKGEVADNDEELEASGPDDDNWDNELGEDDDDDNDEADTQKLQKLAAEASAFRRQAEAEDDSDDDFTDDDEFQAPIDNVDPFILFADIMKGMSTSDPTRFQAYTQSLDSQQQAMANDLAQHAEERRKVIHKDSS